MASDLTEFRCSLAARARCDSLSGTAAPATGWLLIEHHGRWARRALEDSPPDPPAGRAIVQRARHAGIRPLFVRRHGRRRRASRPAYAMVDSRTESATWGTYERVGELLDLDWTTSTPCEEPVYLVCTHGRHDRCCAQAGRPVAAEFARQRPDLSWECSHVGGDRFAGNVLVLPYGLYYGYVDPGDVAEIVTATERGDIHLPLFRGRSTEPPPVQAAHIAVQADLGLHGIDDLRPRAWARAERGWTVSFGAPTGAVTVQVEQQRVADARASCSHVEPVPMRELRVTHVVHHPDSGTGE